MVWESLLNSPQPTAAGAALANSVTLTDISVAPQFVLPANFLQAGSAMRFTAFGVFSTIVAAGLHTAAANWLSNNPSAFWLFNQAATSTPVDDLSTTGTADQTSITGTTVITGDDPPGFDFTLTASGPPPVALQAGQAFPAF